MSGYEQFLHAALNKYQNPDIAKRDVLSVFTSFNDLRPKLEDFVFNDGRRKSLLELDGTIPVNYKGVVYNIPICIWLMDTHPYNPPMVYVKPTPTMQIKSGRNVDMNGKIDLPYLREWKYPNSNLLSMINILAVVFGEEPPVYSRIQNPPQLVATPKPPAGYAKAQTSKVETVRDYKVNFEMRVIESEAGSSKTTKEKEIRAKCDVLIQSTSEIGELTSMVKEINERIKKLEEKEQQQKQQTQRNFQRKGRGNRGRSQMRGNNSFGRGRGRGQD